MPRVKPETAAAGAASKARLHYALVGAIVTITAHTGASNSEYTDEQILKRLEVNAEDFPAAFTTGSEDVTKTLAGYGLQKLLQDRTSQDAGDAVKKLEAMEVEAERLKTSGQWSERKEASDRAPRAKVDNYLARAIAQIKNIPLAQSEASLKALTKEQRDTLTANETVAGIIASLKAEAKDAKSVDLADLLA